MATARAPMAIQIAAAFVDEPESAGGAEIGVAETVTSGAAEALATADSAGALAWVDRGAAVASVESGAALVRVGSGVAVASGAADSSAAPTVRTGDGNSASEPSAGSG